MLEINTSTAPYLHPDGTERTMEFVAAFESVRWSYNKPTNLDHSYGGQYFDKGGSLIHWDSFNICVYRDAELKTLFWGVPIVNIRTYSEGVFMSPDAKRSVLANIILHPVPEFVTTDNLEILIHCESHAPWLKSIEPGKNWTGYNFNSR